MSKYISHLLDVWIDEIADAFNDFGISREDLNEMGMYDILMDYDFWDSVDGSGSYENFHDYIGENVRNAFNPSDKEIDEALEELIDIFDNNSKGLDIVKAYGKMIGFSEFDTYEDLFELERWEQTDLIESIYSDRDMLAPYDSDYVLNGVMRKLDA